MGIKLHTMGGGGGGAGLINTQEYTISTLKS